MATFTYKCDTCKEQYETLQSVHDDPLTDCEKCKKGKVSRVIVPGTSFRIGGGGVNKPTSMFNVSSDPGK